MWARVGAAVVLFIGIVNVMLQALLFQGSPLIGVAFMDCTIGCIGIFAANYMTKKPATLYLVVTVIRLACAIAFFVAFLATFNPKSYLSHLLCQEVGVLEHELDPESTLPPGVKEAADLACKKAGTVVMVLVSLMFVLSVTLCWFPCFRCGLYLREVLVEKEALEGLLEDADDQEEEDEIMRRFNMQTPEKSDHSVVGPPIKLETFSQEL